MRRVLSVSVVAITLLIRPSLCQAQTPASAQAMTSEGQSAAANGQVSRGNLATAGTPRSASQATSARLDAQASGTSNASTFAAVGPRYNVTQFGAAGTGFSTTGSIKVETDPSLLIVDSSSGFAAGQKYNIPGAGVAGANLIITVTHVRGNSITFTPAASISVNKATIDDTAGIQAAFNACWAAGTGVQPYGGTVEFPGTHTYLISGTINAYDSCKMDVQVGADGTFYGAQQQATFIWNGPAVNVAVNLRGFTVTANTAANNVCSNSPASPCYPASSPCVVGTCVSPTGSRTRAPAYGYTVSFRVPNSYAVGQWVLLQGFTDNGVALNRAVAQIVAASGSSFTVVVPFIPAVPYTSTPMSGAYTDSGTATSVNVAFAFDSYARYQQEVNNVALMNKSGISSAKDFGVGFWLTRTDTGSRFLNTWVQGASGTYFDIYLSNGAINTKFDNGWRTALASIAQIYMRSGGGDNLLLANGTANTQADGAGASVMIDQSSCDTNNLTSSVNMHSVDMEQDQFTIASGYGVITFYNCPNIFSANGLQLTLNNVQQSGNTRSGLKNPGILVSPPTDLALQVEGHNFSLTGGTPARRWSGVPGAVNQDTAGANGRFVLFDHYAPINSIGLNNYGANLQEDFPAISLAGDVNVGQFWHYGVKAFDLLYGDTAFSAFSSGTTLFAGQILAPPIYWSGAKGKRYAIDVVSRTGTVGTLNGGSTTCTTSSTGRISAGEHGMVCNTANGLQEGQAVVLAGGSIVYIKRIDATNPTSVLVATPENPGVNLTAAPLSYVPPALGLEMQLPTRTTGAPSTLSWSVGDVEWNAAAKANGIAGYENVSSGTPGTWAAIPLGNASGVLNPAQAGVATGTGTYSGGSSDTFTVSGATPASHCTFSPTNSTAAAAAVVGYISSTSTNSITISHAASVANGGTVSIICTVN